ncbi:Uncharacterised protein [Mycobacteroides abscessus subsp. abscessus]|nr:Uncharacterised protein [Mycobacteroides abscessus subsp. abscessus]
MTTWVPLPASAFRYAGSTQVRVLPSPVFISAMFPACSAAPPITCTSKCRWLSTRQEASRATANASGIRSSRVSPFSRRPLNSPVLACSSASESFSMSSDRVLT